MQWYGNPEASKPRVEGGPYSGVQDAVVALAKRDCRRDSRRLRLAQPDHAELRAALLLPQGHVHLVVMEADLVPPARLPGREVAMREPCAVGEPVDHQFHRTQVEQSDQDDINNTARRSPRASKAIAATRRTSSTARHGTLRSRTWAPSSAR